VRVAELVAAVERTAFDIARHLWSHEVAAAQPVLVTWEVLGHVDVLVHRGPIRERWTALVAAISAPMKPPS
jgi:hypothetical protein